MKGQEFKILFKQDRAYLTPDNPLTLIQAGLSDETPFKSSAFWTIRVINYIETEQRLFCEILSYHVGETDFPFNQQSITNKLKAIKSVTFRHIDTGGLLNTRHLNSPICIRPERKASLYTPDKSRYAQNDAQAPIKKTISETFSMPFKNIHFKPGYVVFGKMFKAWRRSVDIRIDNSYIKEEFDAVKNYFANVLNTKKIQVTATIEMENDEIKSVSAQSSEIDRIDERLIDDVKFEYAKAIKSRIREVDKTVFTMDEYFDAFGDENLKASTLYNNEKDFFEDLLKITHTKHYRHLSFLSSKHKHEILKLRFIHKPFSFIFLYEGEKNYHLVWETLDTEEATYTWHVEKDIPALKNALKKIEDVINTIRIHGKSAYVRSANDSSFDRIRHDYSDLADGFVKWKDELESMLV